MLINHLKGIILPIMAFAIIGCTQVPKVRVWQPWTRTLKSNDSLSPTSSIAISVDGKTNPLLGDESLTAAKLKERLEYLMARRGFKISKDESDYEMQLTYGTDRIDKYRTFSATALFNSSNIGYSSSAALGSSSGLGVSIAQAVGAMSAYSLLMQKESVEPYISYAHTISLEIFANKDSLIWKGESTWDTQNLDILDDITPAMQLLISHLPSDSNTFPIVPLIKSDHATNYFKIVCLNRWFACPALPFRISFKRPSVGEAGGLPGGINDVRAMAAYVDLIQTAEYAVPTGDRNWSNPLSSELWKKATLGGTYILSDGGDTVNILIQLSGQKEGYIIDGCRIAKSDAFENYKKDLENWRQCLRDYFGVFE